MTNVMSVRDFGDALIKTGDLDPVYYVRNAGLPEPQLCRWLLAYWCFYHVGAASWLSEQEGENYWWNLKFAAENKVEPRVISNGLPPGRWPRAPERRHFRGDKCVRAVEWLRDNIGGTVPVQGPEAYVRLLALMQTEVQVMDQVKSWPMFGPWIAFKAADMMERVYGAPVKFSQDIGLMYEEPREGLRLAIDHPLHAGQFNTLADGYTQLLDYFHQRHEAPPCREEGARPCGPQEVETVLCKWKSHARGHYWVGKDIHEVREALPGWGETAERILRVIPQEVPAQAYA